MRRVLILPVIALLAAGLPASPASADSLLQILEKAVRSDPLIREAEANRLASREGKPIARGALLPQINGSYSWQNADARGSNAFSQAVDNDNDPSTPPVPTILTRGFNSSRSDTLQWQVQLTQSVFRWDQWVRLGQADRQAAQADVDYQAAQQDLMVRVAEAYFNELAAEDSLASAQASKEAIGRQLEQSNKRFEVGLIAITDVQEAQAAYDQSIAAEILAKRTLANTKEALRAIIDEYPAELSKPALEIPLAVPVPADEARWVDMAMQQNRTLISSQIATEIAKDDVRLARSGHYPSLDFVAGHSDVDVTGSQLTGFRPSAGLTNPAPFVRNPNDFTTIQDSFGLQLSVPIFSGGTTSAKTQQAVYKHRASRERLEQTARETERKTRDAYLAVLSDISSVKALKQAFESAKTALKATEAGYDVGTRTTVDVLNARQAVFTAETNYLRSRYDYLINGLQLKQAAGSLSTADISQIDALLTNTGPALPPQVDPGSTPATPGQTTP
ncbi:MAG: TolC family outer membrane protein [Gammaproteobacteria bacterium]